MSNAFHGSLFFKRRSVIKTLRIMNFMTILLLACCMQISAHVSSQGVTLNVKKAPLDKVFREIREQTGYTFMYTESMIKEARKVSIQVKDSPLQEVLDLCFSTQPFTYNIIERTVVVQPRAAPATTVPDNSMAAIPPPVQIRGRVVNQDGEPLQNASVLIVGTKTGTTTNSEGYFTLTAPGNNNISLEVSSVGYQTKRVNAGTQTEINITLEQEVSGLSDVVVIGYGTAKKSDLTGSVSQIDARTFQNQSMTQITDMLTGTASGVYATQGASAAGGGSIEIRGRTSLTAETDPLVVLDGAIYNGSISDINPNDVESIDILKDASSAAVFGSKAASGVILITTKRGKTGKPTIDFSSKIGVATTTHDLRPFGPKGYLDMHRDFQTQFQSNLPYGYFFHPDELPSGITIDQWRSFSANPAADNIDEWITRINLFPTEIENYKAGKTTDFYDLVVGQALRQDYSIGVGGGTSNLKYYWSGGYLKNEGIITGDQFSTIRTRLNLDIKVTDWLSVGTNTQFAVRDESVAPADLGLMVQQSPYGSMWNEDGTLKKKPHDYITNPLENYYGQDRLKKINTLFSILYAQVKLPFGFQYKLSFQPSLEFSKDYNFWSSRTTKGGENHVGGYGTREDVSAYHWLVDNILTWNREIGAHKFDLTLLANAEVSKGWSTKQENSNFAPNENLGYNGLQFGSQPGLTNSDAKSSGDALMARLNYSLLSKYLFTASVRRDGYSAFGQENPHATFPSFAFAWKVSDESFFNISWMNRMKLRLSWGANGNRDIGIYAALARLGSVLGYDGSNVQSGVYNTTLANSGLRWERTESTNIGLDMGLFQNRVDVSIDVYDATTIDLLMDRQLPIITGYNSITANLGELGNRGLELSINTENINNKNFGWRSGFTFSFNKNKIKKLFGDFGDYTLLGKTHTGEELPDFSNEWFPGQASDVIWNYDVIGVWQLGQESDAAVYGMIPGDYKATDVNKDGKFLEVDDKKFIGYTLPRYRLGLRNEFTFLKNWSASVFIRADLGHIRAMTFLTQNKSVHDRINTWSLPYWSPTNPVNDYQRYDFPDNVDKYGGGLTIYKPTGFLRVQDISLSYNLPESMAQHVRLNSLRVFGSIRNFLTFTKWPGFDPESDMVSDGSTRLTPMPKVFTIGVNLTL